VRWPPSRDIPTTTDGLHQAVMARLGGAQRRILSPLLDLYPEPIPRDELAQRAGYEPAGNPQGQHLQGHPRHHLMIG
jgi:hypothetical protein